MDIAIKPGDVSSDGINRATLIDNLIIDHHQFLQTLLHIQFVGFQATLLLFNLLAHLCLFILQAVYRDTGFLLAG